MAIRQRKGDPKGAAKFMRSFQGLNLLEQMTLAKWIKDLKVLDLVISMGEREIEESISRNRVERLAATLAGELSLDPYSQAFAKIWEARRAGRPVPPIDELLPDEPQRPGLRLVYSRD